MPPDIQSYHLGGMGYSTGVIDHRSPYPPSTLSFLRFKMRPDIQSYHLGGMGCGTGVMGINLMRDLLKVWTSVCGGGGTAPRN